MFLRQHRKKRVVAFWLNTRKYKKYNNINKKIRETKKTGLSHWTIYKVLPY